MGMGGGAIGWGDSAGVGFVGGKGWGARFGMFTARRCFRHRSVPYGAGCTRMRVLRPKWSGEAGGSFWVEGARARPFACAFTWRGCHCHYRLRCVQRRQLCPAHRRPAASL